MDSMDVRELTQEELDLMDVVADDWASIFWSYPLLDQDKATQLINMVYESIMLPNPKIVFVSSPLEAQKYANKFYSSGEVCTQMNLSMWKTYLRMLLGLKLDPYMHLKINPIKVFEGKIEAKYENIKTLYRLVVDGTRLEPQSTDSEFKNATKYFDVRNDMSVAGASSMAIYEYFTRIRLVDNKKFNVYSDLVRTSGIYGYLSFDSLCVVYGYPEFIKSNAAGLHSDKGPAVRWASGYEMCYLNNIRVPDWVVNTPLNEMDSKRVYEITNVDVRREFVRRVGVDKLVIDLKGDVIDEQGDYKLILLDIGDGRKRPYLKMLNPSVPGVWHVEGIDVGCKTVDDALDMRKPPELRSIPVDDVNGAEWFQQGDVCIWNKGAKSVRRRPSVLT